jgi:hypothetical protein
MQSVDVLGYAASLLVVVTFYMKDMVPLRAAALASNVLFLSYGLSLTLGPVALLHAALIPINIWRLSQALELAPGAIAWLSRRKPYATTSSRSTSRNASIIARSRTASRPMSP